MELEKIYNTYYEKTIPRETFESLLDLDPTSVVNKKMGRYCKWILNLWIQGKLKDEDRYKVRDYLETLSKHRFARGSGIDVCKCKDLPDLYDRVRDLMGTETRSEVEKEIKAAGSRVLYQDRKWLVYQLLTWEASRLIGSGTQWCTASKVNRSAFDNYTKRGPLLVFINKETSNKYQFHICCGVYNSSDRVLRSNKDDDNILTEIGDILIHKLGVAKDILELDLFKDKTINIVFNPKLSCTLNDDPKVFYDLNVITLPGGYYRMLVCEENDKKDRDYYSMISGQGSVIKAAYSFYDLEEEEKGLSVYPDKKDPRIYYYFNKKMVLTSVRLQDDLEYGVHRLSADHKYICIRFDGREIRCSVKTGKVSWNKLVLSQGTACHWRPAGYIDIKTTDLEVIDPSGPPLRASVLYKERSRFLGTYFAYTDQEPYVESIRFGTEFMCPRSSIKRGKKALFLGNHKYVLLGEYPKEAIHKFILIHTDSRIKTDILVISPYGWTVWDPASRLTLDKGWCRSKPKLFLDSPTILRRLIDLGKLKTGPLDITSRVPWFKRMWKDILLTS